MPEPAELGSNDQPKVLRDPVHNLITIPREDRQLILGLLDNPVFQRLRRIRQLGVSMLTYPGAEHSRWGHSLGVQHVARRMLDALRDRYRGCAKFKDAIDELEGHRREILVAALLHDVGHGPFSHVFEKALPKVENPPDDYPKDHEGWSVRIIKERFSDFLAKHDVNADVVAGLINKTDRHNLLAKDFISSQLDADRIDYLLRDSHATGAKYGEFDLEWLLHSLRIGEVKVKGEVNLRRRLCVDGDKARPVVEKYIQARHAMYVQVYIHKTSRAYEAMLNNILGLAVMICDADSARAPQPCPPALASLLACRPLTTQEYLSLDDFRLWTTFMDWAELEPGDDSALKQLRDKCRRLVHRGRPYRALELNDSDDKDKAVRIVTKVEETPQAFSCLWDKFEDVAYRNIFYRKGSNREEQEDRAIYFIGSNGQTQPAEDHSKVIRAISEIEAGVYRLYFDDKDPRMMERLDEVGWPEKDEPAQTAKEETP